MYKVILETLFNTHGPPGLTPDEWSLALALADNLTEDLRPYERHEYRELAPRFDVSTSQAKRLERTLQLFFLLLIGDEETNRSVRLRQELYNFDNPEWLAQHLLRIAKDRHQRSSGEVLTWETVTNPTPAPAGSSL